MKFAGWLAVSVAAALVVESAAVWVWLSYVHDGPDFPY